LSVQPADIYLIDEPSAYLDSEQRIVASKVIKRYILHARKTAFIVEHDFIMAAYLADKVVVYEGQPSVECTACTPQSLVSGMNRFLSVSAETASILIFMTKVIIAHFILSLLCKTVFSV
jgi:ATP-binding cassette subfamily E protein 1